jgi:threonine synthase
MLYASTRGGCPSVGWEEAISSGYAPDGGLYVPVHVPRVSLDTLKEVRLFMQRHNAPREPRKISLYSLRELP